MSTLKSLAHVLTLVKGPGGIQGPFSHEIIETEENHASLLDVDPFLMLKVFAFDTNKTKIKHDKVSIF